MEIHAGKIEWRGASGLRREGAEGRIRIKADEMEEILKCYMAPAYSSESINFYLAIGPREVTAEVELDKARKVVRLEFHEVLSRIEENIMRMLR